MAEFEPNLVLDNYAFLVEAQLREWSKFSRGFRGRDGEGNYYILEVVGKKRRDIDLLLEINHKTILNCLDIKPTDDGHWVQIFEYFQGDSLRDLLNSGEKFSELDIAIICFQICNGLSAIHSLNLIHEDFRPENIIINSEGEVKLKGILIPEVLINYQNIPEIWNYVAPEQISKSVWISPGPKSNLYSLGSIIYELITGKKYGKSVQEMASAIEGSKDPLLSLRSQIEGFPQPFLNPDIPDEFKNIILNSLFFEPDKRMDIKSLSDILASFINKSLEGSGEETVQAAYEGGEEVPVPSEELKDKSVEENASEVLPSFIERGGEIDIIPHSLREEPVEEPVEEPAEEPVEEPAEEPIEEVEEEIEEPEEPVEEFVEQQIEEPEEPVETGPPLYDRKDPQEDSFTSPARMLKNREELMERDLYTPGRETTELNQNDLVEQIARAEQEETPSGDIVYGPSASENRDYFSEEIREEDKGARSESEVKEFIPSVSGGFFSRDPYENLDYSDKKGSSGEYEEHTYQTSVHKEFDPLPKISSSAGLDNIVSQLNELKEDFKSFQRNTGEFINKFSNIETSGGKDIPINLLSHDFNNLKASLKVFFGRLDELFNLSIPANVYTDALSVKIVIDSIDREADILKTVTRGSEIISSLTLLMKNIPGKLKSLNAEEDLFISLYRFLIDEYGELIKIFKDKRTLKKLLQNKEILLRIADGFRLVSLPEKLKYKILAYMERLRFISKIISFYNHLEQKSKDEIDIFFRQKNKFLKTSIFSEPVFEYDLQVEDIKENYDDYIKFPLRLSNYLKEILKSEYEVSALEINMERDYFDYEKHNIVGKSLTAEREKNYKIAEVVSDGYIYKYEIIEKADVKIYTVES